jgi:hypothetical protein
MERERRIELMRRQSGRRFMNVGLTRGFVAIQQCALARRHAMHQLRQTARQLKAPALSSAWSFWAEGAATARATREQKALRAQMAKESGLKGDALTKSERLQKQVRWRGCLPLMASDGPS